ADILQPRRYIQLGFTIDGRSGLGTLENYFLHLLEILRNRTPHAPVLEDPAVKRRCQLMMSEDETFRDELREHSSLHGNVVVTDFRGLDHSPVGNRFLIYALFPEANVSARIHWGPAPAHTMALLGNRIFTRSCKTNVGELAARYGGGGHRGAGSIPLHQDV